jgi:hypothetical protein
VAEAEDWVLIECLGVLKMKTQCPQATSPFTRSKMIRQDVIHHHEARRGRVIFGEADRNTGSAIVSHDGSLAEAALTGV